MKEKKTYTLDGSMFSSLEEFAHHFSSVVLKEHRWNGNLDAFNDILRGGFGTPEEGFVIRWRNSDLSKLKLGYPETIRQLKQRLETCHPTNRERVARDLEAAKRHEGATAFDWLVEIINVHCRGGLEAEDGVELILE
jgi:RNAse (barnase) inhibitor barstar